MAIEAPLSRHKRNDFILYIVACLAAAAWFAYDGYISTSFRQEHTDEQGKPDSALVINRQAPPFLVGGAVLLGAYFWAIKGRKVVAAETELVIAGREKIPYDAIEQIDKTHFEKKGVFTITYKKDGRLVSRKLTDRQYGPLAPILDHLIAKIT
jgi:hypothetical protein